MRHLLLVLALLAALPATARAAVPLNGPVLAVEDTMRTEVAEVLVRARRVTLDEILDRVARGEARRDSLLRDQSFTATLRAFGDAGREGREPQLLFESVSRVYKRKPAQVRAVELRRFEAKRRPGETDDDEAPRFSSSMGEEIATFAFRAENRRDFRFTIEERRLFADHLVYVLRFEPRAALTPYAPSGRVWVDTRDFVILRQEIAFAQSPVPLFLKGIRRMVVERERSGDYWVLSRVLIRADFTLPLPRYGRSADFAISYRDYTHNTGLPDSLFGAGRRASPALPVATEQAAPEDSLVRAHLSALADSTSDWFGLSAHAPDTTGLDSTLAVRLADPTRQPRGRARLSVSPELGFDRVEGGRLGARFAWGGMGRSTWVANTQWTSGSQEMLGSLAWRGGWRVGPRRARVSWEVAAGRWGETFDLDHPRRIFGEARALLSGRDPDHFLRSQGVHAMLRVRARSEAEAQIGWRDLAESPLSTTTEFSLTGRLPEPAFNLAASHGRVRELELGAGVTLPGTRQRLEVATWAADPVWGSEPRYRRWRVRSAGDVSIGRSWSLLTQGSWTRLRGDAWRQRSAWLGGTDDLRSVERRSLQGTGTLFLRADLVWTRDLGRMVRLPVPLQPGVFVASGAAWGKDAPLGAPRDTRRDGPLAHEWLSEAGASFAFRLGVPEPGSALLVEWTHPLGADARLPRVTVSMQTPLAMVRAR